ncbi:TIGR00282 family metallophosphoesterase [Rhabdaerophilum calidifontis]|uniref:TIGR00282 family metallophosphoesterase n=1 Tax=Rhabdaerophilum calidifontis TaxID=2604328 RepID=UPI00123C048A|nr:TIGR00282 family metallophosphoesterase [Rhabdaerophilum calidifontis]
MRILFLGDVVGRPGREAVTRHLPALRARWALDCVVINGENSAGTAGITEAICAELLDAGADCITLGNHAWDQREALVFITREHRLIRPANFAVGSPGRGAALVETRTGARVLVVNLIGRVFMGLADDPFAEIERQIAACPLGTGCDAMLIDMHAEATSEKQALAYFVDGRASAVVGTHTHVPTADQRILPGGTAYLSDAGMCGDYDSILGVEKSAPLHRFLHATPSGRFEATEGTATLCGFAVETDDRTGLAKACWAVRLGPLLAESLPQGWE